MRLLLMNGPNLNMLGIREPDMYGQDTLADIEGDVQAYAQAHGCEVDCFQSNHEGALIDKLHEAHLSYDGIIYNPGAHTHYSYALRDAVASIKTPVVEVHITDVDAREPFRAVSVFDGVVLAKISGRGKAGYLDAVDVLIEQGQDGQGDAHVR